jgi:AraC-like DNA-binding protein
MDPLSETLSLLKLNNYVSGGFVVSAKVGFQFPRHPGIKCYAAASGSCWLLLEGADEPVRIDEGDCVVLPQGLPFCLATDLSLPRVNFPCDIETRNPGDEILYDETGGCSIVGGHFPLTGSHSDMLLNSLPSIVHIRREADKETIRWSLKRLREELRDPQPGGSLMAQQLAYMILLQALRLYLQEGAAEGVGLLFGLADPNMRMAITWMHDAPGDKWTLQGLANRLGMSRTVFAQKFKERVGLTSMEYLTRWRMLLASDRLKSSDDSVAAISSLLGYETESAFGRAFRRFWGCSPREHRRPHPITSVTTARTSARKAL